MGCVWTRGIVLLADKVAEVGNAVGGVADEEALGLLAVVLIAVGVGENGRDLTV